MAVGIEDKQVQLASTQKMTDGKGDSSHNLWQTMLRDAMRRSRLPDGTLVFVGPQGCGKSSLLDTFLEGSASSANPSGGAAAAAAATASVAPNSEKGPESGGGGAQLSGTGAGIGGENIGVPNARGFHPVLAYSYLDATDPEEQGSERDDSPPRVSVWCCSEPEFEGLLQTVLRPEQLTNTAVVVGVDLSRPWEVMDALEQWTKIAENHITKLLAQLSVGAQDDLRNAVKERFRAAQAGSDGGGNRLSVGGNGPPGGGLGEGILERNIGVPMVVVGCKADSLQSETFEQQQRLHFIQQSLRRFCLKYGAALVYTSAKDGVNCTLLHRYLLSCLYPEAFRCTEDGQTSDAAFIPAGWDSKRLIDGLLSPDKTPWGPSATFAEVVAPPPEIARRAAAAAAGGSADGPSGSGEEEVEVVEPEEVWLSNLEKQVAGVDGRSRWPSAISAASKVAKASKSTRPGPEEDPRSFFAKLLAGGSGSVSSPPQQKKK